MKSVLTNSSLQFRVLEPEDLWELGRVKTVYFRDKKKIIKNYKKLNATLDTLSSTETSDLSQCLHAIGILLVWKAVA